MMAEYIECRNCDSPDCKGCNIKTLETMLKSGKLDCLMNANRSINPSADVSLVRHGYWEPVSDDDQDEGQFHCSICAAPEFFTCNVPLSRYCYNCGARMDGDTK